MRGVNTKQQGRARVRLLERITVVYRGDWQKLSPTLAPLAPPRPLVCYSINKPQRVNKYRPVYSRINIAVYGNVPCETNLPMSLSFSSYVFKINLYYQRRLQTTQLFTKDITNDVRNLLTVSHKSVKTWKT